MKEFLKTNTVTHNLMAFTGFKSILIFTALLESPKSCKELQDLIRNHEYLHEDISPDTVRIYINSLKEIGCNVVKTKQNRITRYYITQHPFNLTLSDEQVKSIMKAFKAISKSIDVADLISLQDFFKKISDYIINDDLKERLANISPLSNINSDLIKELMFHARNNNEITVLYESSNSKEKNITILVDKLHINNGRLYLSGYNSEYNSYSKFLVTKIKDIVSVNLKPSAIEVPEITVGYQYKTENGEKLDLLNCEKLIKTEGDKNLIEITHKNKFEIMQRVLYHGSKCTVLYPEDFRNYVILNLKKMKEGYIGQR